MKRAIVCTGVLGGGTAIVFALALAVAVLFPQGALIRASWNGGFEKGIAMPMPAVITDDPMANDVILTAPAPEPVPASIESPGS